MQEYTNDTVRELLVHGVAAAKSKDYPAAYRYLMRLMNFTPPEEALLEAWYWLSVVSPTPKEQRDWAEQLLANKPTDVRGRRRLAVLDGKLKDEEIIDPDRLTRRGTAAGDGLERFTCPQCGGRMSFAPDGQSLTCDYCEGRNSVQNTTQAGEQDFMLAMAAPKGHLAPLNELPAVCQGCGAEFILPAGDLSISCPHCNSAYVVRSSESREIIAPTAVVPFEISEDEAKRALLAWFKSSGFEALPPVRPALGLYLPVWEFSIGGTITWRYEVMQEDKRPVKIENEDPILYTSVKVAAVKRLSAPAREELESMEMDSRRAFNRSYLASWPAETYDLPVGDASLTARQRVLESEKGGNGARLSRAMNEVQYSSANMLVEAYQLILAPLWLTAYTLEGRIYEVAINGQNGRVRAQKPLGGFLGWLAGE